MSMSTYLLKLGHTTPDTQSVSDVSHSTLPRQLSNTARSNQYSWRGIHARVVQDGQQRPDPGLSQSRLDSASPEPPPVSSGRPARGAGEGLP